MCFIYFNDQNNNLSHCYLSNELEAKMHLLHVKLLRCFIKLKSDPKFIFENTGLKPLTLKNKHRYLCIF